MSGIAARPGDLAVDFIGSFKEDCELRGMSPMTIERYVSSVRSLKRYVESEELDLLNTENKLLLGYLNHLRRERGLKQRTIENDFAAISSFYEFLQFKGYADKNPVISIRKRYLRNYKDNDEGQVRRLITLE
ncbi:Tyrosine recombinase XerC [uncultured archaeon]|nr:Tyrosine recombinase XerC [uncultured archaeon]